MTDTERFLRRLFANLEQAGVEYAVLKRFSTLPYQSGRDLDFWVSKQDFKAFKIAMFEAAKQERWRFHGVAPRLLTPLAGEFYFSSPREPREVCVVDVSPLLSIRGISFMPDELIKENRVKHPEGFWHVSPDLEAVFKLLRGNMMGVIKEEDRDVIALKAERSPVFRAALESSVGRDLTSQLLELIKSSDWEGVEELFSVLRRKAMWIGIKKNPLQSIINFLGFHFVLALRYLIVREGLAVAIIGPDGGGKTTAVGRLAECESVKKLFNGVEVWYRRVHLPLFSVMIEKTKGLRKRSNVFDFANEPGGSIPVYSVTKSFFYMIYLVFYYTFSRFPTEKKVRQRKMVIFDRYFYDYLAFREHSLLPDKVRKLLVLSVPKPDLIVLLKADPEVLYARKGELDLEEAQRQLAIYEIIVSSFYDRSLVVETDKVNEHEALDLILERVINEVTRKRLKYFRILGHSRVWG